MNKPDLITSLSHRKIFIFWYPLALTWLFMSVEGPLISAFIARLPFNKINLAAYGVAFSFALIIESPIIMLLSASTALVKDKLSFVKLFRFTLVLNGLITVFMIVLLIPFVFDWLVRDLMNVPDETIPLIYRAVILLLPWPSAIGFRRFYQGILIRFNKTRYVTFGTIIRLLVMGLTAWGLYSAKSLSGAWVGASALSAGVVAEAVISRVLVHNTLKKIRKIVPEGRRTPGYMEISKFYFPLAATSILTLGAHPVIVFFLGHSREALNSLAVLPVLNSFIFIFRSVGLSFQEAAIALMDSHLINFKKLKDFTIRLSVMVSGLLLLVIFSPGYQIWFGKVIGLKSELVEFAFIPTLILMIMPALATIISFQRAVLVVVKKTAPITIATVFEFIGIMIVLFCTTVWFNWIGIMGAAISFVIGRLMANSYLQINILRYSRE